MDKRCEVCGKTLVDDAVEMETGQMMCKECWEAFDNGNFEEEEIEELSNSVDEMLNLEPDEEHFKMQNFKEIDRAKNLSVWTGYVKICLYVGLILDVIIGAFIGAAIMTMVGGNEGIGLFIGGAAGFLIAFTVLAFVMIYINMAEDLIKIRNNTTKILYKLNK